MVSCGVGEIYAVVGEGVVVFVFAAVADSVICAGAAVFCAAAAVVAAVWTDCCVGTFAARVRAAIVGKSS